MYNAYKKRGMLVVDVEIPPYTVENVDFFDLKPNYFRVQNMSKNRVFCGVSKIPTETDYDFFCKSEAFSMYAEPHNASYLYLYNPSGNTIKARVLGFAADFDPLALAFSQIEIDFAGMQLETVGAISEFKTPLPAGTNNIGKVSVSNWPTDYAKAANQHDCTEAINNIHKQNYVDHVSAFNLVDNQGVQIISNGGLTLIHMLTNDGDTDFSLVLGDISMPLKPGETIADLKFNGTVKLNGETYSARMLVSYP